ncbi:MAG: YcxB family protein [Cytophagales bacterium]|nr:YcxB family protein [Cytophagales bacterium]
MIVKTKKTELDKNTYIKIALTSALLQFWYAIPVPFVIGAIAFAYPKYWVWFVVIAVVVAILYVLFWLVQFVGVTQLPQNKLLFDKMYYEIDSRHILLKINAKEGMQLNWDQIKKAKKGKDYFVLFVSIAQLVYLPYKIFNSENEIKFTEALLKRKGLIK